MSHPFDLDMLRPPTGFISVLETLETAGFQAWAVGGALRDGLERSLVGDVGSPGRQEDWDVATDAHPHEVIALFPRTVPLGVEHGTVGVLQGDGPVYETTTFRLDVETDGRHATVAFADSIDEDLARRDFTINAMAWRRRTGEFRDPFDGASDLEAGLLRAVGDPSTRFAEDYLRVLRGLRFAGQFDLDIEPDTRAAIVDGVPYLSRLSAERVREELMKVLASRVPSTALDLYRECGALEPWFPEIALLTQDRAAWRQHLGTVDAASRYRPLVRLARLLAPTSEDPEQRAALAHSMLERLRFSNADRKNVTELVRLYLPFPSPLDSSAQLRSWLADAGDSWRDVLRLHVAGARASTDEQWKRLVAASFRGVHGEALEHPPLRLGHLAVSGEDVLRLGVPPGPIIGLLLEELLEQVLEDPDRNDRDTLMKEAERLIEIGALTGPRAPETGGEDG